MSRLESNHNLNVLVPASLLNNISCYVTSDEHPLDVPVDIVVCTTKGEIIELLDRQVVATLSLEDCLIPRDIKIHRNISNHKYYLVSTFENLYVVSTKPTWTLHKNFKNVDRYVIDDMYCSGIAQVRIWSNEDAIPCVVDDNFELINYGEAETISNDETSFVSSLKSKLTESRHTVNVNEERYKKLLKFRQESLHVITVDMCPNEIYSSFHSCEENHRAMKVENIVPWLKLCNRKVVIGILISNDTSVSMTDIKLILQSNTDTPMTYRTDMYSTIPEPPYWVKMQHHRLSPNQKGVVVAVTEKEKFESENTIKYSSVIVYTVECKKKFVPLEDVKLSCLETLNESFDILSTNNFDPETFAAVMSTTHSLKLKVRHVNSTITDLPDVEEMFKKYMKMDTIYKNVLIHRTSPWHVLNGVMVILKETFNNEESEFTVYLRSKSQLSSLLHLMYDGIPYRLLITTSEMSVKDRKTTQQDSSSMELDPALADGEVRTLDMVKTSLLRQTKMILEYFDDCMASMASNRSSEHLVGTQIDLTAVGVNRFHDFSRKLNEEIKTTGELLKI